MKKEKEKKRLRRKAIRKKILAYGAVYGILPGISLGLVALMLSVRVSGAGKWEEMLAHSANAALYAASGGYGVYEEKKEAPGLPDFAPPLPASFLSSPASSEPVKETGAPEKIYPALPAGAVAVRAADLRGGGVINSTDYSVDLSEIRKREFPAKGKTDSSPLVLVLHTHGTEGYLEDDTNLSDFASGGVETYFLPADQPFRSRDPEKNVVAVGEVFVETLLSRGIPALHCTVQHDAEDFNSAYTFAAATIRKYLEEYPSLEYVIDLHRDSITRGSDWIKTTCTVDGQKSAQVMLVVGTNARGNHPRWLENLTVQTAYKDCMDARYPGLSRSLYLRTARFNQEFRTGSMLLEVGSSANTLEEAKTAARAAAECLADLIEFHS